VGLGTFLLPCFFSAITARFLFFSFRFGRFLFSGFPFASMTFAACNGSSPLSSIALVFFCFNSSVQLSLPPLPLFAVYALVLLTSGGFLTLLLRHVFGRYVSWSPYALSCSGLAPGSIAPARLFSLATRLLSSAPRCFCDHHGLWLPFAAQWFVPLSELFQASFSCPSPGRPFTFLLYL